MDAIMQAEVSKRIQAELGNLIVQLTVKDVEIERLRLENAELKQLLDAKLTDARPESGQHKENSNGH